MKKQKVTIGPYLKSALIVVIAFLVGFFLSSYADIPDVSRGGRVQLVGVFQQLDILEQAIQSIENIVGTESTLIVEEQVQGPIQSQYMVSIDGTLAPVEQPLQEYGYIVTVADGQSNPYTTSVISGILPVQYYVLVRELIEGGFDINTYLLHD
jgi:hypothetical protein